MTRLDELYALRASIDASIEREKAQLWAVADLRDKVHDLLSEHSTTTAATIRAAAEEFSVNVLDIATADRSGPVTNARHVAAWLLRDQGLSYPEIGRVLARDHTTAINSCRRVGSSVALGEAADRVRARLITASAQIAAARPSEVA